MSWLVEAFLEGDKWHTPPSLQSKGTFPNLLRSPCFSIRVCVICIWEVNSAPGQFIHPAELGLLWHSNSGQHRRKWQRQLESTHSAYICSAPTIPKAMWLTGGRGAWKNIKHRPCLQGALLLEQHISIAKIHQHDRLWQMSLWKKYVQNCGENFQVDYKSFYIQM